MNGSRPEPPEHGPPDGPGQAREDRFQFHKHALMWLGRVAISAIAGVVVMTLYDHGATASSLTVVATAAVAAMAALAGMAAASK